MTHTAAHRYARIAPRKARLVADMIRGMPIDEAMIALEFSKLRAAAYFKGVLKSAIANAEESDADLATLVVATSTVDEGPRIKRWRPKDRGRAHPILKRTSHLQVALDTRN